MSNNSTNPTSNKTYRVNFAEIEGNIGNAIELRHTQTGKAVADISVAVNEKWIGANGQEMQRTQWFKVVVWDVDATNAAQQLNSGERVAIKGFLRDPEVWIDGSGKPQARVVINAVEITKIIFPEKGSKSNKPVAHKITA